MPSAVVVSHDWIANELGHLEPWLDRHGFTVTRIHREQPTAIPAADLLIVLGSPGSVAGATCPAPANDEVAAVRDWVQQGRPFLGICFGAQALARACGGSVATMPRPFAGYVPISVDAGAPAAIGGPWTVWHNDGITAPGDAVLLGELDHAHLAFRIGRAWGLQPHIEVTAPVLERMLDALGVEPVEYGPVVERLRADATNAERAQALLDAFLADVSTAHP